MDMEDAKEMVRTYVHRSLIEKEPLSLRPIFRSGLQSDTYTHHLREVLNGSNSGPLQQKERKPASLKWPGRAGRHRKKSRHWIERTRLWGRIYPGRA